MMATSNLITTLHRNDDPVLYETLKVLIKNKSVFWIEYSPSDIKPNDKKVYLKIHEHDLILIQNLVKGRILKDKTNII